MTMIPATESKPTLTARMRRKTKIRALPLEIFVRFPIGAVTQTGESLDGYWMVTGKGWDDFGRPQLQLQHADDYRVIYVSPREVERVRR